MDECLKPTLVFLYLFELCASLMLLSCPLREKGVLGRNTTRNDFYKRNGVLIGDAVGLGKTLMATALARIFEDDNDLETLIICPKNLVKMWEDYKDQYRLHGRVISITKAKKTLGELRRYRLVLIDESHNLRNREGKIYHTIQEYLLKNESKCIATDEAFFEDDRNDQAVRDLFTEKAGIMDGEADTEVDLASYAYQIWKRYH